MGKILDTWDPEESAQVDKMLDDLFPTPGKKVPEVEVVTRRADELVARKRFLERRASGEKVADDLCGYCERPALREFCGMQCERNAALAALPLKFHG